MCVFKFAERKPCLFFSGKFNEAKTAMIARVHFLGQANLFYVAERLEELTYLVRCRLESQVLDEKFLALNLFVLEIGLLVWRDFVGFALLEHLLFFLLLFALGNGLGRK